MTKTKETANIEAGVAPLEGIVFRLCVSVGLLALALALASRFGS
jgi:hypothetical protein